MANDQSPVSRFLAPISESIWDMKYRLKAPDGTPLDRTVEDSWRRVAKALASVEADPAAWEPRFLEALDGFRFLPAGRILAGAGTSRNVTLFNCFVMGTVEDSMSGIFEALKEAALTMQAGGGIGYDFSTLRPKGAPVKGVGADASGPLSFMDVWDAMCRTIMSAGSRRGAMMATMRCDHPDIEDFVAAKSDPKRLRMFNLSVLVTDPFMEAVRGDAGWDLVFGGQVFRTIRARDLWDRIVRSTYDVAEPGVIFIDRINRLNNLNYVETIAATNPCGEQPLPPYGACLLGSVNLARLVQDPFEPGARLDEAELAGLVATAVRMMDDVVDLSRFPLPQQRAEAQAKRRIGLGVTGLADALLMVGLRYGSEEAADWTRATMRAIARAAYLASADLAREKGAFPLFDRDRFLASDMMRRMDPEVREAVAAHGIRNALLTSIAPTGTISLYAGNVSSGIEPVFAWSYTRKVLQPDGTRTEEEVVDHAVALWRAVKGDAPFPDHFVTAQDLAPLDHVRMQAAAQEWIDSSISKTINVPEDIPFEEFRDVYQAAWDTGCKGCTTYRPNAVTGSVLSIESPPRPSDPALPTIRKRFEWAMERAGIKTGKKLAELAGVSDSSINRAMNGQSELSFDACRQVASVLGVSVGWLMFGELSSRSQLGVAGGETVVGRSDRAPVESAMASATSGSEPLDRPEALEGATYKLRWPGSEHAIYITVNDVVVEGRRRPFEVFINSKNMEHYAWTVALTRMISAVFRRGGEVAFVVDELKAVFDPRGGAWVAGKYVPSILAAIGIEIERHMRRIGFLGDAQGLVPKADPAPVARTGKFDDAGWEEAPAATTPLGAACPSCGSWEVRVQEGCLSCATCGFSRCG